MKKITKVILHGSLNSIKKEFEHSHDFIHFMQQRDMSVELKPVQVEPIKETDPLKNC